MRQKRRETKTVCRAARDRVFSETLSAKISIFEARSAFPRGRVLHPGSVIVHAASDVNFEAKKARSADLDEHQRPPIFFAGRCPFSSM